MWAISVLITQPTTCEVIKHFDCLNVVSAAANASQFDLAFDELLTGHIV